MTKNDRMSAALSGSGKLYVEIATLMRRRIVTGAWKPGERLPPIEGLAKMFLVAVITVRQAVALLEEEGLLVRKQGVGTFVTENAAKRWLRIGSNWSGLVSFGVTSEARIVKMTESIGDVTLGTDEGVPAEAYQYMRRVHSMRGMPYAIVDIYLDRKYYARAPNRFAKEMVIRVLDSLGCRIARGRQTLTIGTADIETAELLKIAVNAPIGEIRRVLVDEDNHVIYVGEAVYRGDIVMVETDISS